MKNDNSHVCYVRVGESHPFYEKEKFPFFDFVNLGHGKTKKLFIDLVPSEGYILGIGSTFKFYKGFTFYETIMKHFDIQSEYDAQGICDFLNCQMGNSEATFLSGKPTEENVIKLKSGHLG